MSYDWSNLHKDTANFVGARLGEIGDGWNAVKEAHPAAANIALFGAGAFTLFNIFQGGGYVRSIGRGIVGLATMLGIAVAGKAIADDNEATGKDTPIIPAITPMGMAIRAARDTILDTETGQEIDLETNTGAPLNANPQLGPVNVGKGATHSHSTEGTQLPTHASVRITGTNRNTPVKHIEHPGEYDFLIFQGRPTSAQFAQVVHSDPSDNIDWDIRPQNLNAGDIGDLTPEAPYGETSSQTVVMLKDEAITGRS